MFRAFAALLAALVVSVPHHHPKHFRNCSKLQPRAELACAKARLAVAHRKPSYHSRGYWKWQERMAHRWIKAARYRIAHPPIPHLALWMCIHGLEGAWNDPNPPFWGGLQMTSPWGAGAYYVFRADLLSPWEQMRKAELGYIASGYSTSWLHGQWPNSSRACGV